MCYMLKPTFCSHQKKQHISIYSAIIFMLLLVSFFINVFRIIAYLKCTLVILVRMQPLTTYRADLYLFFNYRTK